MSESATEALRRMLDERGVEHYDGAERTLWGYEPTGEDTGIYRFAASEISGGFLQFDMFRVTPEQAIAATLGRPKAKSHPYGYEPDTGAFDVTRCECGCLNDVSATYCNDCGGVIEVDMDAEKEIYHTPRHSVFAEKHDDGSLEFGGKRYVAATLGGGKLTAEQVHDAIFNGSSYASYDGSQYYASGIGMQAIADELNATLGGGECEDVSVVEWGTVPVKLDFTEDKSRYAELFGTPERAARTLRQFCADCFCGDCATCGVPDWAAYSHDYDALLEWLRGDAE